MVLCMPPPTLLRETGCTWSPGECNTLVDVQVAARVAAKSWELGAKVARGVNFIDRSGEIQEGESREDRRDAKDHHRRNKLLREQATRSLVTRC